MVSAATLAYSRTMRKPRINKDGPDRRVVLAGLGASALSLATPMRLAAEDAPHRHGIAMHGDPELPAGFPHLPYAEPNAPKGGLLRQAIAGSFDTLNSMSVRGNAPALMVSLYRAAADDALAG